MAKRYLLDFEKPLVELEKQIEQIKELGFSNIIKIKDWETISLKDNFEITLITSSIFRPAFKPKLIPSDRP